MSTARDYLMLASRLLGSDTNLAKAIGFSQGAIHRAKYQGKPTPEMACNIEVATGGLVTREMLRPDIFAPKGQLMPITNSWARNPRSCRGQRRAAR